MKKYLVKDLMVPISEYATVSEGATLFEAMLALEKAQEEFAHNRYSHRAVLIMDKDKRIVGKLNQLNFLRALKQDDEEIVRISNISQFGFNPGAIMTHQEKYRAIYTSGEINFSAAGKLKVEDFMQLPSEGEYIEESASLDTAVHQLVAYPHISMLVTKGGDIVGILRLSDVFAAVFHAMKESELKE